MEQHRSRRVLLFPFPIQPDMSESQFSRGDDVVKPTARDMHPIFGVNAGLLPKEFKVCRCRFVAPNALCSNHDSEALAETMLGSFEEILIAVSEDCQIPAHRSQMRQRWLDIIEHRLTVPFLGKDVCLFVVERESKLISGTRQG